MEAVNGMNAALADLHQEGFKVHWKQAILAKPGHEAYDSVAAASHTKVLLSEKYNNPEFFKRSTAEDIESGYHSKGTDNYHAVFTHEAGHGIASAALRIYEQGHPFARLDAHLPVRSDWTAGEFYEAMQDIGKRYHERLADLQYKHGIVDPSGSKDNIQMAPHRLAEAKAKFVAQGKVEAVEEISMAMKEAALLYGNDPGGLTVERLENHGGVAWEFYQFTQDEIAESKRAYFKEREPFYISGYASENIHEFMAEGYTAARFTPNASEYAHEVYSLMRQHLRLPDEFLEANS